MSGSANGQITQREIPLNELMSQFRLRPSDFKKKEFSLRSDVLGSMEDTQHDLVPLPEDGEDHPIASSSCSLPKRSKESVKKNKKEEGTHNSRKKTGILVSPATAMVSTMFTSFFFPGYSGGTRFERSVQNPWLVKKDEDYSPYADPDDEEEEY